MSKIQKIIDRKFEIRTLLESDENVDLDKLENELRELDLEQKELEKRQRLIKEATNIANGQVETRTLETFNTSGNNETNYTVDSEEYRTAWAKDMLGQTLTPELREIYDNVNNEYRQFTHTTENTAVLIPTTVVNGIWKRAEESYPLWADVKKLRVKGTLTMIKHTGIIDGDAKWYDEPTSVEDEQNAFGTFNLTGCELSKSVTVSWKLKKMAIKEFISFIEQEIAERIGVALGYGVALGKGKPGVGEIFKPEPNGIITALNSEENTPQIVTYTDNLTYDNITTAMSKIHSSYANGLAVYANYTTIWTTLAQIKDNNGRPLFVADVMTNGVGRILGYTVKVDASIPDKAILIANANKGYLANINEDMTMHREEHIKARTTDYMGYAIVDGDVIDTKAFAYIKQTVTP